MKYGATDDIFLKHPEPQVKQKGRGFLFVFIIIFIASVAYAIYWYYTNYILEDYKEIFFKYVAQNNFDKVLDIDIYYNMLGQMSEKSFSAKTTSDLTTTMKNDFTSSIDANKLSFSLLFDVDREYQKSMLDAKISYSSNDLINVKLMNTIDSIGIYSEEILDKYIASDKSLLNNSISKATSIETNISADIIDDTLKKIPNSKINLDEEYKNQVVEKYFNLMYNLISSEAVTAKENVAIDIANERFASKAYVLNLDAEQYKEVLKAFLSTMRNDEKLLSKIVTGVEKSSGDESLVKESDDLFKKLFSVLVLNQKVDGTVEEFKKIINQEISSIPSITEGITITVYVRTEDGKDTETVKFFAELPNKTSIDTEYSGKTKFKVTFLYLNEEEAEEDRLDGSSIEIEKKSSDVNIKYDIQYSKIENKSVVSKVQVNLETDHSNSSKGYTNNAIVKYKNSKGDMKFNIKNEIKFERKQIDEELNDENSIFIDKLNDEDAKNLYLELDEKVATVYNEKLKGLSIIDNNSVSSIVQQPLPELNTNEKAEIKEKLIEIISNMMAQAQRNEEEFSIENLADLNIEGYEVQVTLEQEIAIIRINGYVFTIDSDFMLSE